MIAATDRGTTARRLWPRRRDDAHRPVQPEADSPLMRFLTLGGAVVELRLCTRYDRPRWECLGCGKADTLYEISTARDGANEHASICRAMPKPEAS
jgi:hypothetical protein